MIMKRTCLRTWEMVSMFVRGMAVILRGISANQIRKLIKDG